MKLSRNLRALHIKIPKIHQLLQQQINKSINYYNNKSTNPSIITTTNLLLQQIHQLLLQNFKVVTLQQPLST